MIAGANVSTPAITYTTRTLRLRSREKRVISKGPVYFTSAMYVASLVSLYYYLMVIKQMYIGSADGAPPVRP